jgi:diphthamide biosynthesis protein 2
VALTNTLMRFPTTSCALWQPSDARWTEDVASMGRAVKRRYFLVQKAKDANIVGILVGTLGVAGYRSAIERLRTLVRGAGKRCYVMSMGRVAPAKLANFAEVDVFVLVACAQTALVDSKEYYAPVITPFEAELAFCDKPWPGHLRLDFNSLIEGDAAHTPSIAATEPRFSLLTGTLTGGAGTGNCDADGGAAAAEEQEEQAAHGDETRRLGASRELAVRAQRALAVASSGALAEATSGAEYLVLRRSYQGMEAAAADRQHAEPVLLAVPGHTGRAATYQHES